MSQIQPDQTLLVPQQRHQQRFSDQQIGSVQFFGHVHCSVHVFRYLHSDVSVQSQLLRLQRSQLVPLLDKRFRGAVEQIRLLPAAEFIVARPASLSLGRLGAVLHSYHPEFRPRPPQPFGVGPGAPVVHHLAAAKRHLGVRIGARRARPSNHSDSTPALAGLGVATGPEAPSRVTLAGDALLPAGRLIVVLLAVTLARGLVAGRVVAFRLVAMAGAADRRTPPGCRTGLVGLDLAVIAGILGRVALASIASAGRRVLDTGATVVARIQVANALAAASHPPGRAYALARLPLGHADRCFRTVYVALGLRAAPCRDVLLNGRPQQHALVTADAYVLEATVEVRQLDARRLFRPPDQDPAYVQAL